MCTLFCMQKDGKFRGNEILVKVKDPRQLDAFIRNYENACTCVRPAARSRSRNSWSDGRRKKMEKKERRSVMRGRRKYPMRKRVDDWNIKRTARVIRFLTIEFADSRGRAPNLSQNLVRETKESRRKSNPTGFQQSRARHNVRIA